MSDKISEQMLIVMGSLQDILKDEDYTELDPLLKKCIICEQSGDDNIGGWTPLFGVDTLLQHYEAWAIIFQKVFILSKMAFLKFKATFYIQIIVYNKWSNWQKPLFLSF